MISCTSSVLAIAVFVVWGMWFHCISVAMQERCRALDFVGARVFRDKSLNKSIIKNVTIHDEEICQLTCFLEDTCKSYNLGPPVPQPTGEGVVVIKRVCELSSSHHVSHPDYLVSRPGFIYRPSANLCGVPCPDKQSCYPVDNGGFSCLCPDPGFTGYTCTEDIDECAADTHDCDEEANCTNNVGSFICTCHEGYQGNGKTCQDIPFHWTLNGTDRLLNLSGAAKFEEQDGITVLYLDGSPLTYAETPAIPIQSTDLTIAVWVKLMALSGNSVQIYGDWSFPHQFRIYVNEDGRLCADAIRASGKPIGIFGYCKGVVSTDVWSHVVMTWGRLNRTVKLYINGEMKLNHVVDDNPILDFKNSGHTVYDIGLKRDNGVTIHASFSDLMIFNRELSENEIRNKLFQNHPLHSFI